MTTMDLFADLAAPAMQHIGAQALLLRGMALDRAGALLQALAHVQAQAPFRHMHTPGGRVMSVALTNCGGQGWISDRYGYRYSSVDPGTGQPWPAMPAVLAQLACEAAAEAGFDGFSPDACLINRYVPGARLSLHQDRDERDLNAPIVSVSLGMTATFLFGGHARTDRLQRWDLSHGDVLVWGGQDRLRYHGVLPLRDHAHPVVGRQRINFTLRKAG
ncbi:DNA oxidative demethylase AlkB [Delftia sp. PS-11]|uniref:DNA oxidative demethylase AlkB n=1 Tax=Delftia sp. PS-11 TaxID=2767222 RepID=UPI002456E186|nr:DNA oxidative demethylase AlkB [Delftia sp. PS-11]KAJ8744119.1 DNA oxidative demethylase AlkB [Delftia sp. PS-11]